MANQSPAYRWYPKDILSSLRVSAMTAQEECWYRRALDFAWLNDGIPSNPAKLARVIGKGCTKGGARVVLEMFQKTTDPMRMVSERQEIEREKQRIWSEKSAQGGKASKGKRKKQKPLAIEQGGDTKRTANGQPKGNIPFPSSSKEEDLNTHTDAGAWEYPMKDLLEAFPQLSVTPAMVGFIEAEVKPADQVAWAKTISIYRMNFNPETKSYLPEKTANLLSVFRKQKADLEKERGANKQNSTNSGQTHDERVAAESAKFYEEYNN